MEFINILIDFFFLQREKEKFQIIKDINENIRFKINSIIKFNGYYFINEGKE